MAVRQVYVSKSYASFWVRAEKKAAGQGDSLSEYLSRLIRKDILSGAPPMTAEEVAQQARESIDELLKLAGG